MSNLAKHRLDFREAEAVFRGPTFTIEDHRFDYEERRFITMGMLRTVLVVLAHTEYDELIRVVSMRRATRKEQALYVRGLAGQLRRNQGDE